MNDDMDEKQDGGMFLIKGKLNNTPDWSIYDAGSVFESSPEALHDSLLKDLDLTVRIQYGEVNEPPRPSDELKHLASVYGKNSELCIPLPEAAISFLESMVYKATDKEEFRKQLKFERLLAKELREIKPKPEFITRSVNTLEIKPKPEFITRTFNTSENSFGKYCNTDINNFNYTVQQLRDIHKKNILKYWIEDRKYTIEELVEGPTTSLDCVFEKFISRTLDPAYLGWLFSNAEFNKDLYLLQKHARQCDFRGSLSHFTNNTEIRAEGLAFMIGWGFRGINLFKNLFKDPTTLSLWPVCPEYLCFCKKWRLSQMLSNNYPVPVNFFDLLNEMKMTDDLLYPHAPLTVFDYYADERFRKAKLNNEEMVPRHLRPWAEMLQGGEGGVNKALRYARNLHVYLLAEAIVERITPHLKISNRKISEIMKKVFHKSPESTYRMLKIILDARRPENDMLKNYVPIIETAGYRTVIDRFKDNWYCTDGSMCTLLGSATKDVYVGINPETGKPELYGDAKNFVGKVYEFSEKAICGIDEAEQAIDLSWYMMNDSKTATLAEISRSTLYRNKQTYLEGGTAALEDKMRDKPLLANRIPAEHEIMVLRIALEYPELGREKCGQKILSDCNVDISQSTIQAILTRHDLSTSEKRKQAKEDGFTPEAIMKLQMESLYAIPEGLTVSVIIDEFVANPKITRSMFRKLLSEKYKTDIEPEILSRTIQKNTAIIENKLAAL